MKRPNGLPNQDTWNLDHENINDLSEGEIIIQNLYISIDPAMRGWMNKARSYIKPDEIVQAWGEFKKDPLDLNMLGEKRDEAIRIFDKTGWK